MNRSAELFFAFYYNIHLSIRIHLQKIIDVRFGVFKKNASVLKLFTFNERTIIFEIVWMIFEIETISRKKFLIGALTGALLSVVGAICLGILFGNAIVALVLIISLLIVEIYISHLIALSTSIITVNENSFNINNQEIHFDTIAGYFINETGLTMTALDIKLKSNAVVTITGITFGRRGKLFREFTLKLINAITSKSSLVEKLTYQGIYEKQSNFLRLFIYVAISITLIIDLIFLYQIIVARKNPPWQLLFLNTTLFSLLPYIKQRKNKLSNSKQKRETTF